MNTRSIFFVIVIMAFALLVGCSRFDAPTAPKQDININVNVPDEDGDGDGDGLVFSQAAEGSNLDYLAIVPVFVDETNGYGRVRLYLNKNAVSEGQDYPRVFASFTDNWSAVTMQQVDGHLDWFYYEPVLATGRNYKFNFLRMKDGQKTFMSWERIKEVGGRFAYWDTNVENDLNLPYGTYGGDLMFEYTIDGKIRYVPGSGTPPWERGGASGMSMSIRVTGLGKSTGAGDLFVDTNLGIVSGQRVQKAWPISAQIPVAVFNSGNIAVGDGLYNKEFEVDIFVDGVKKFTFTPKYNANVYGRGVSCLVNLRLNGEMDQDGTFAIETLFEFKYKGVSISQDDNSRWNTMLEAYPTLPIGSEWVELAGQMRSIWLARQMADGSNPYGQIGVPESEVTKGSITDPTGKSYKFSQLEVGDWFSGHKLVKFFYDRNNGAITGATPLTTVTRNVRFYEEVSWSYTIWPETGETVTLNPGQFYNITLTAQEPDTSWFRVFIANNDGLRAVKVKYESTIGSGNFNQTMVVGKFDYNPADKNTSVALVGLVGKNGAVVTRGTYMPTHILGGG